MRTLYIDCTNGASGDMLLRALKELAEQFELELESRDYCGDHGHEHHHHGDHHDHADHDHGHGDHSHDHGHGRSFNDVKHIIGHAQASDRAKEIATGIYTVIAKAESTVHEATLETVHFHEVGRDQAINNAIGIGAAIDALKIDEIVTSAICDGSGFVDCAHGRIPVPVPAVRAMMDLCGKEYPGFEFRTCEDVDTEMVTPSGLASVIGMGAKPAQASPGSDDGMMMIQGQVKAMAEAQGTRDTGRSGLKMYVIEG